MSDRTANSYLDIDWSLLALILLLLAAGLVMLTSASISVAENSNGEPFYYLIQQLLAVAVGLFLATFILRTPTAFWQKAAPALMILATLLLVGKSLLSMAALSYVAISATNVSNSLRRRLVAAYPDRETREGLDRPSRVQEGTRQRRRPRAVDRRGVRTCARQQPGARLTPIFRRAISWSSSAVAKTRALAVRAAL